jgi:wobble nucleotide-excising tRNase
LPDIDKRGDGGNRMKDISIDLSSFADIFAETNKIFPISKKVNFVFGKNGTGKSTITGAIQNQFISTHNVCVFRDFEDTIGENKRLDAIALGKENTKIQKELLHIDEEIAKIKKLIDEPDNKTENLFTKSRQADNNYREQEKKIDGFCKQSATKIKNLTNPQIAKTSYDKNSFIGDIKNSKLLSEEEIRKHKETIKSEMKETVEAITFPNLSLNEWIESTNEILQSIVSQQQVIEELKDNIDKQNFAKTGMDIHKHREKCSFCGNEISDARWQLLGSYFNDEVKKLEIRIKKSIEKIENELVAINTIKEISKNNFYKNFIDQIEKLNLQIKNKKNEYKSFFESLKFALENKSKNIFVKSDKLNLDVSINFGEIEKDFNKIAKENNDFSQNLTNEQDKAKNTLRYHEVKMLLDTFNYEAENANLASLKTLKEEAQKVLIEKKEELNQKAKEKNELILQTKDEKKISEQINKLLKNMGVASFSLELVNDTDENQKGQYQIKGHNNKIRPVTELSKGEKNIIAFLYFLFSLEKNEDSNKPKIIVLDDPMTSNDDTMQYLMIGEIIKFYRNLNDKDLFILLTHNCHFYLNVRPSIKEKDQGVSFYEKYGNYHLYSDGKHTTIKNILKGKEDFLTNYEMLWKELLFLYNSSEDTSDIMLNPCRKICETYTKFIKKDSIIFYGENTNAKKLFDVNQHSIDDLEAEQNGKTKEEIKNILKELFINNNAEEHFNSYFKT